MHIHNIENFSSNARGKMGSNIRYHKFLCMHSEVTFSSTRISTVIVQTEQPTDLALISRYQLLQLSSDCHETPEISSYYVGNVCGLGKDALFSKELIE